MAGPRIPTDVKQNAFIEANGYAREVVEKTFRLSPKSIGIAAIFGVAVPFLIYKGIVMEFVRTPRPHAPSPPLRPVHAIPPWFLNPSSSIRIPRLAQLPPLARVTGSGFRVWGLGFRVWGLGYLAKGGGLGK